MDFPERLAVSSATSTPTGFYSQEFRSFIFPALEPWAMRSGLGLAPQVALMWTAHSSGFCLCHLLTAAIQYPLHPGSPSPPLLLVWMNMSSLNPWLSDFHTVLFFGSSGYFFSLNLLLSFFWLCEEAKCITSILVQSYSV